MTTIVTVGHGNRGAAELEGVLTAAGVEALVDVRSYPRSRRFPWFAREALAARLEGIGIGYRWAGRALGGRRRQRPDDRARHPALAGGFAAFATHMEGAAFTSACAGLVERARERRTALLCAERDPAACHRALIADYLVLVHGVEVVHWLEPDDARPHVPDPAVQRAADGGLRYARGHTASLWRPGHGD